MMEVIKMEKEISELESVIANAKLVNHTHLRFDPSENVIYSGHEVPNGWKWIWRWPSIEKKEE